MIPASGLANALCGKDVQTVPNDIGCAHGGGMIQRAFQHRSGRVISTCRLLLALLFAVGVSLEPTRPLAFAPATQYLLLGYAVVAAAVLAAIWDNWWLEARLGAPAHVFDLATFTVLTALTGGYASPFFGVFIFLVLSAAMRWGWREATLTVLLIVLVFFAAGLAAASGQQAPFDLQRFVLRASNLVVLSLMIIWFGVNHFGGMRGRRGRSLFAEIADSSEPPVLPSLDHAASQLSAGKVLLVWSDSEEPWLNVATLEQGVLRKQRLGPEVFPCTVADDLAETPFLFDLGRSRILVRNGYSRTLARRSDAIDRGFAAAMGLEEGLAVPIRAEGYQGYIFACAIPGLCSEDLIIAGRVGEKVSAAFERTALFAATRDAASARARLLLARDLHDSVVQFQAGMALKLQGLRLAAAQGVAIEEDLEELQLQLGQEQRDLRNVIGGLRELHRDGRGVDLGQRIATLCRRLESQWGVQCEIRVEPATIAVLPELQHDIDQLIREAVANAVRHGSARNILIRAALRDGRLHLHVEDDGGGFPTEGEFGDEELARRGLGPRSLKERVHNLGGQLKLATDRTGSRLAIALPFKGASA